MKTVDEIMTEINAGSNHSGPYRHGCYRALRNELEGAPKLGCDYNAGSPSYDAFCYGYEYGLSVARGLKEAEEEKCQK